MYNCDIKLNPLSIFHFRRYLVFLLFVPLFWVACDRITSGEFCFETTLEPPANNTFCFGCNVILSVCDFFFGDDDILFDDELSCSFKTNFLLLVLLPVNCPGGSEDVESLLVTGVDALVIRVDACPEVRTFFCDDYLFWYLF